MKKIILLIGLICLVSITVVAYNYNEGNPATETTLLQSEEENVIYLDDEIEAVFEATVTPSDELKCGEDITVELSISVPDPLRIPVDIMLVMDRSGSMDEDIDPGFGYRAKMDAAKDAAKAFVNLGYWDEGDQIGLVSYATPNVTLDSQLMAMDDSNKANLNVTINSLNALGGTPTGYAVEAATTELNSVRANPEASKIEILLTDGYSNCCPDTYTEDYVPPLFCCLGCGGTKCGLNLPCHDPCRPYLEDIAQEAKDEGITIYTIGFGMDEEDVDKDELEAVANITGGKYYFAATEEELNDIYDQIAELIQIEIKNIYVVIVPAIATLADGSEIQLEEDLIYDVDSINPGEPWTASYTLNIPCDSDLACDIDSIRFPGEDSYIKYKYCSAGQEDADLKGESDESVITFGCQRPIAYWDEESIVELPFRSRDLGIEITSGEVVGPNEVQVSLKASNRNDLSSVATDVRIYVGEESGCGDAGAPKKVLSVEAMCGGKDDECDDKPKEIVWTDEELSPEGMVCARINEGKQVSECPRNNSDEMLLESPSTNIKIEDLKLNPKFKTEEFDLTATAWIKNEGKNDAVVDVEFYISEVDGTGKYFVQKREGISIPANSTREESVTFSRNNLNFELERIQNYFVVVEAE
ncbi:VWA domain-containing protein, partial [Candidatus Micrarchaeota archaeon]|nr:VWA domain-containing protein [Candidatus Micrarchaeota archaeon]